MGRFGTSLEPAPVNLLARPSDDFCRLRVGFRTRGRQGLAFHDAHVVVAALAMVVA